MKKMIALIVMILVMASMASAQEIRFRNIEWTTDVITVLEQLDLIDVNKAKNEEKSDMYKLVQVHEANINEFGSERMIEYSCFDNSGYVCMPVLGSKLVVAEHEVKWLELQFVYGMIDGKVSREQSDSQLYTAKYEFKPDDYLIAYEDLLDKLIWLYGEPVIKETINNESFLTKHRHEKYAKWEGENGTALLLYVKYYTDDTNKFQYELSIEYGKTDVSMQAEIIEQYMEQEERNEKYTAEDMYGL